MVLLAGLASYWIGFWGGGSLAWRLGWCVSVSLRVMLCFYFLRLKLARGVLGSFQIKYKQGLCETKELKFLLLIFSMPL